MKLLSFLCLTSAILFLTGCASNEAAIAARQNLRDSQTPFSQNAFIESINTGDSKKVSLFLTGGIETEMEKYNYNALTVAVESNKPEIVTILLTHGVKIDPPGSAGTPLCIAASNNYADIADTLIAKGADVDYLKGSLNPMIIAAAEGNKKVLQALLKAEADINVQGESTKFSPLMLAARNGHTESVKLLLEHNPDTQLMDYNRKTALSHAVFAGRADTADMLINDKSYNSEDATPSLILAISLDKIKIAKKIIEKGSDLNAIYGSLPLLSWAIMNNHTSGAELLINSGADVNKAGQENMIALDYALAAKNEKIIKMLRAVNKKTTLK